MPTIDWAILDFLSPDPKPIRDLLGAHRKATVYRRLRVLHAQGLVAKHGTRYSLTTAGEQAKAEREAGTTLEGLTRVYSPLSQVPTPQHRAVLELALGALVLRQHTDREERHAGFLLLGPTLTWKTSAGRFICLAAGADPATCIVDLATESGQSLWIRRGPTGEIVAQRALLEARVVIFDEYQFADRAVRRAIAPFISGRRRVPVENDAITISPVPVITMNPGLGDSLTARTGLSVPQLRRLVPCDLGSITLPDLALEGGRALEAARQAGPVRLRPPQGACEGFRQTVVRLLRQALVPEAVGIVDVDLVLGLGTGLMAWLPPLAAMRLALYDFLLLVGTVGWVVPGWLGALRAFPGRGEDEHALEGASGATLQQMSQRPLSRVIPLFPDRADRIGPKEDPRMNARDSMMPSFSISDWTKARVIWLSQEAGVSVDQALQICVDLYSFQRAQASTFEELRTILYLRDACETAEVAVEDLRQCLELERQLSAHELSVGEVRAALEVAEGLAAAGLSLEETTRIAALMDALEKAGVDPGLVDELRQTLDRYKALGYTPEAITPLAQLAARLKALGITTEELAQRLQHLERLGALGLDANRAEQLATALDAAGAHGDQRTHVLAQIVEAAVTQLEMGELRARRDQLRPEVQRLEAARDQGGKALAAAKARLAKVTEHEKTVAQRVAALEQECETWQHALVTAMAFQKFLLGNVEPSNPFFAWVAQVWAIKTKNPGRFPHVEQWLTGEMQKLVVEFLQKLATMPVGSAAPAGS